MTIQTSRALRPVSDMLGAWRRIEQEAAEANAPRVLGSDAAYAVGRFLDEPVGYVAKCGGPIRDTRAEAEADFLAYLERPWWIREQDIAAPHHFDLGGEA